MANVTIVASTEANVPLDFAETIRRIVREELLRHQQPVRCNRNGRICDSYVLQDAEANTLSPSSVQSHDASSFPRNDGPQRPEVRDSARTSNGVEQPYRRPQRPTYFQRSPRPTFDERFDDVYEERFPDRERGRPTCYNCGLVGHISCFYRRRRRTPGYEQQPIWTRRSARNGRNDSSPPHDFRAQPPPRRDSPDSDRSITSPSTRPRRSPSPRRWSPPPEN